MSADRYTLPEDYEQLTPMAEELLHARTLQLFRGVCLPDHAQQLWDKALMLQITYMDSRGGLTAFADPTGLCGSVTLGRFSVSGGASEASAAAQETLSPAVAALLPTLLAVGRGLDREAQTDPAQHTAP